MTTKTLCKCGHEISQHSYSENFTGCDIEKCDCYLDVGLFVDQQAARIAELTAANESMQEDAVQNTYAFGLMLQANKEQVKEITALKSILMEAETEINIQTGGGNYSELLGNIRTALGAK